MRPQTRKIELVTSNDLVEHLEDRYVVSIAQVGGVLALYLTTLLTALILLYHPICLPSLSVTHGDVKVRAVVFIHTVLRQSMVMLL